MSRHSTVTRVRLWSWAILSLLLIAWSPEEKARWQARNDRGNRYEGTTTQDVAAAPLVELIGFHAVREEFGSRDDRTLNVTFFNDTRSTSLRLTAREIDRQEFYWMEAKPALIQRRADWSIFEPWPVRAVLRPHNIDSKKLAVLVRLDGASRIAPAFVRVSHAAADVRAYEVHFVAGKALRDITCSLTKEGVVLSSGERALALASAPVSMRLPIRADIPPGPMRLEVTCRVAQQPVSLSFDFHHEPRVPSM